ncbi:hypothetical protein CF326_g6212 [Tilletia indica]|nr:hypothetical protein CF326_g6212 [Tilletia indica]
MVVSVLATRQRVSSMPVYQNARALDQLKRASSFQARPCRDAHFFGVSLVAHVWTTLCSRLHSLRVPTNTVLLPRLHSFLDPDSVSLHHRVLFVQLLDEPLRFTDDSLGKLLPIKVSIPADPPSGDGSIGFYLRSFPLQVRQLRQLIHSWEEEDITHEEVGLWASETAHLNEDDLVYIRYVGTFGSSMTPLQRFSQDLRHRDAGVLSAFLRFLTARFPEVLEAAMVYVFETATLFPLSINNNVSQSLADDRERLLIALFDHRFLLNRQPGGFFGIYQPRADDAETFAALNTRVLSTGMLQLQSSPPDVTLELGILMDDIFNFMLEHPVLTGTSRLSPGPGLKSTMLAQATPSVVQGRVLIAVLGRDITLEDFLQPRLFLKEYGSRAGHLLLQLLKILQQWEFGLNESTESTGTTINALFPFFDLIPWPRHDLCQALLDFLGRYLRIVQPIVVLSCSQLVSSVLLANLEHSHGLPTADFLSEVGIPRMCNYMDPDDYAEQDPEVEERDPEASYVVVPALHPGFDRYGPQHEPLRRVMLLTLQVCVALANLAQTHSAASSSRANLVARVMSAWFSVPVYEALRKVLSEAKADLRRDWKSRIGKTVGHRVLSEEEHAIRSFSAQVKVTIHRLAGEWILTHDLLHLAFKNRAKMFIAEGPPCSLQRTGQTLRLWRLNWPDLHLRFGRDDKEGWFRWMNEFAEGKAFFASSIASLPEGDKLMRLCQQYAPGEDLNDPAVRQAVIELVVAKMQSGWAADKFSSEKQAERGRKRLGWRKQGQAVEELRNAAAKVWVDGRVDVAIRVDGNIIDVTIQGPQSAIPKGTDGRRWLNATHAGVDLIDEDDTPFRFEATDSATWTKETIGLHSRAFALIKAWEEAMDQPFHRIPSEAAEPTTVVYPPEIYGPRDPGSIIPRNRRRIRTAAPRPNESDWIVWVWLQEQLGPQGGQLFLCKTDEEEHWAPKLLASFNKVVPMVRSNFRQFLLQPKYVNYPWRQDWQALLDADGQTESTKKLTSAFSALRGFTETGRSVRINLRPGVQLSLNGKVLTFEVAPEWSASRSIEGEDDEGDDDIDMEE